MFGGENAYGITADQFISYSICNNCINGICSTTAETCESCNIAFAEINCNTPCTCENGTCSGVSGNGTCSSCNTGYVGLNCEIYCNCSQGTCNEEGICSCFTGFTGPQCDQKCFDSSCNISCSCDANCVAQNDSCTQPLVVTNATLILNLPSLPVLNILSSNLTLKGVIKIKEGESTINDTIVEIDANSTIQFGGNFSLSSSDLFMDSNTSIEVANCITINNSTITVDLHNYTASELKLISSQCTSLSPNSKIIYTNVPHGTCPRVQEVQNAILILLLCETSNAITMIPILLMMALMLFLN